MLATTASRKMIDSSDSPRSRSLRAFASPLGRVRATSQRFTAARRLVRRTSVDASTRRFSTRRRDLRFLPEGERCAALRAAVVPRAHAEIVFPRERGVVARLVAPRLLKRARFLALHEEEPRSGGEREASERTSYYIYDAVSRPACLRRSRTSPTMQRP